MGFLLVNAGQISCSFGAAPAVMGVIDPRVKAGKQPAANIMDNKPAFNIKPFGMCSSMANPTVAAATAAALGVLTPQPCTPMTMAAPWTPGKPMVKVRKLPAVDDTCTLNCIYGGIIQVAFAGQTMVKAK